MSSTVMETTTPWTSISTPSGGGAQIHQDNLVNVRNLSVKRSRGSSKRDWREGREGSNNSRKRRKREKALGEKVADWFRAFLAFLFSNVGIVCLVVGYTIAGAFIFEAVEGSYNNHKIGNGYNVSSSRNYTAIQLWQLTTKVRQ